ncbi:MAG TPA: CHASE3 domain-containing protein, partial [Chitinophagaceae bacterium]|nr:CHASE3 domain-containing protein [Chitinophagaceae bacterium]
MLRKRFIYYIIATFVAGNALLIFIQYTSTKNVNLLISGNEKVISELRVRNDLKELDGDITYVDNKIAGTLYTKDSSHLAGMDLKIDEVKSDIDSLQRISDDDTSVKYIDVLDRLVNAKLSLGKRVLDTLYLTGRQAAENLLNSDSAKNMDDSIKIVTNIIETSRQKLLASVILSISKSGKKALSMGTVLIVSVLFAGAILFWFIITTLQKQSQLIAELNAKDKKLREAAKIKDNFLANMSHEIRTPL